jgi:protein ImuB
MSALKELYACLYAREISAQALLRLRPELRDRPCVVMEGEAPLERVCSLNMKARRLGVQRGMTRVELDMFPSVVALARSLVEEKVVRAVVLECAGTFSPRVEDQSEGSTLLYVLDIAGTERLLGSPEQLAQAMLRRLRELGLMASVTVCGNLRAGVCLARGRGNTRVVGRGEIATELAALPLSVLDLSEQQAETFELWGIRSLGALARLPEEELIARMGQVGKQLRRLARGEMEHLFVPMEAEFHLEEKMELDSPVEVLDSLLFVLGVMLGQLIVRATMRVLALASVSISLLLEGGGVHRRTVKTALPTNERQIWLKLLHLDLEGHPPLKAIVGAEMSAEPGCVSTVQMGLFTPLLPEATRLDVTLARIQAIVGEGCVGQAVLRDSHRPDAFHMEPFTVIAAPNEREEPMERSVAVMRQLRPPERLVVTSAESRLSRFFFRGMRYEVEQAYGPWIKGGEWWSDVLWNAEEWDVVARSQSGSMLCCCLVRDLLQNVWHMVALYD